MTTKMTAREQRAATAAELARRDNVRRLRMDRLERAGATFKAIITPLVFLAIAAVALSASFSHLRDLCIIAGQDASHWYSPANTTPIVIDFLMLIASVQLRRTGITGTARLIARLCMTGGLLASIAGNLGSAWLALPASQPALMTVIDLAVAVTPAVVLWGAVEMLTHTRKTAKAKIRKPGVVRRLMTIWIKGLEERAQLRAAKRRAAVAAMNASATPATQTA